MTFEELYNAIKTYADSHSMTLAQLANVKQHQVAAALNLSDADRMRLGASWDSLRGRIRAAWEEDAEAGKFDRFRAEVQARILAVWPQATFRREGPGVFVIDINGGGGS